MALVLAPPRYPERGFLTLAGGHLDGLASGVGPVVARRDPPRDLLPDSFAHGTRRQDGNTLRSPWPLDVMLKEENMELTYGGRGRSDKGQNSPSSVSHSWPR